MPVLKVFVLQTLNKELSWTSDEDGVVLAQSLQPHHYLINQ